MLRLLDTDPFDKHLIEQGYSKEECLRDYDNSIYETFIINYYLNDKTISSVVENGKNCKLSYYFIEKNK